MSTFEDVWNSIRDFSSGHASAILAIVVIGIGGALLLWRPSFGEMSASRLQSMSLLAAVLLVVVALAAAVYAMLDFDDGTSVLRQMIDGFKDLHVSNLLLLVGLVVLVGASLVHHFADSWIAKFGSITALSLSMVRDFAVVIGVFLLLAAALVSVGRYLLEGTFSKEYSMIAPFVIAGSEDKQRGQVLAAALQAKLVDIERDAETLNEILQSEKADREVESGLSQELAESSALNVYRKIDLELKFQGVDVGSIFSRVLDWFATRKVLQVSVAEQNNTAIVSGALSPDGKSHVYAEIGGATNERIVAAVAYSKLRERLTVRQPGYENLKWDDVEALHNTVVAVTDLRGRSEVKMEQFKPHLQKMTDLIAKAPRLNGLLMLGAEVAMKAGEVDAALSFLDRVGASLSDLRDSLDRARPDPGSKDDEDGRGSDEFRDLRLEFVRQFNALVVQRQRALSNCALPFVERLRSGEVPARVFGEALAVHRDLLRIAEADRSYQPTVAIIGGVPQRDRVSYAFETRGEALVGRSGYDNFADTLGMIVSTLAPHAKLLFVPLGANSHARGSNLTPNEDEIEQAARSAVAAGADIAVVPFSFRLKRRMAWIADVADKILVVSPAPSKRSQERFKLDVEHGRSAFIGNVDVDGRFKLGLLALDERPVIYPGALWAPGSRIPRLGADGMWQATYGAGYASATAAAVFANLLGALGKTTSDELLDRVRKTVHHFDARDPAIGVIDQAAALKAAGPLKPDSVDRKKVCGS